MKVYLQEQECTGTYKFNGQICYTRGIEAEFGDRVFKMIADTFKLIRPLVESGIADYFQVAIVDMDDGGKIKVWIIDDIDHITFLLPCEY